MANTYSLDIMTNLVYNMHMLKRAIVILTFLAVTSLTGPVLVHAQNTVQTCTTSTGYNGAVTYICGAHTPVNTGIGDSLPLIASGFLGAAGVLGYFSKKFKRSI